MPPPPPAPPGASGYFPGTAANLPPTGAAPPAYAPPAYAPPAYAPPGSASPTYAPPGYSPPSSSQPGYRAPAYGPAPRSGIPSQPQVSPPDPSVRNHDGFYLRLGLGAGYYNERVTPDVADGAVSGFAGLGELALGGTLWPGFVVGGGMTMATVRSANSAASSGKAGSAYHDNTLQIGGLFADWYPEPGKGMHLQGMLGLAGISVQDSTSKASSAENSAVGFGLVVGVGNEWWVADQWSLGVLGRFQAASLTWERDGTKGSATVLVPGVLLSATYH